MFEPDATDFNGIGAIGGLGLEPAAGAIPLTGTNDQLTGGMGLEVLAVPTLGAENYDTTVWPLDSAANGPPPIEEDGPIEGSPSSVDPLMGVVADGQGEPSISGLMDEAVKIAQSGLQELAAGPDLREKLREENGGSEATQDATPDWLTGNFSGLPLALNTGESDVQEQAESQYRTASAEFPQEEVNLRSEWIGGVHDWSIQGEGVEQPSPFNVNDALDDPQKFQGEGVFNLGSNIRDDIDGRNGINNANWGSGSVKGYEGLPDDRFLVKGYTEVDRFDFQPGQYYRFEARGDDGYQIWVKNLDTEQWDWVTPENQWQTTTDQGNQTDLFLYKVPETPSEKGYYVGFFHYENGGEANFGLNWAEMNFETDWYVKAYDISGNPQRLNNYERSNTRSDGKKGFESWWDRGAGPHTGVNDDFDMILYTQANFERGQTYNFNVTADDGYAVGVIPIDENGSAQYVTPWEVNKDAYSQKTYSFTPQNNGKHWVVAYYSEDEGDSSFDLSWESASSTELSNYADRVSSQFLDKVSGISERLGVRGEYLMAVMGFETGGTYSPSIPNEAGSGAVGLIQFMPTTATGLGTSTQELASMSDIEQLDYVERYFSPYRGRLNSLEDVYMAVLWPRAIGRGSEYVLWDRSRGTVYEQNSGLDSNNDGVVTAGEATDKVRGYLA